jgi:tRNA modification GTPase
VLLDQCQGALRRGIDAILVDLQRGDAGASLEAIEAIRRRAALGARLTTPWTVMFAGRPNVGKSSLLNALLGYERAIVFDRPGTTRDLLRGATALDGWPFELWDAAGLRCATDPLEAAGVSKALELASRVDLVALVFAADEPWTAADAAFRAEFPGALMVMNKTDLLEIGQPTAARDIWHREPVAEGPHVFDQLRLDDRSRGPIPVSARTGQGVDALCRAIVERLIRDAPAPGAAICFTAEQRGDLDRAAQQVAAGELAAAIELLRDGDSWRCIEQPLAGSEQ